MQSDGRPSWQLDVYAEQQELSRRLKRLKAFNQGINFPKQSEAQQQLLLKKQAAMEAYAEAIDEHIATF